MSTAEAVVREVVSINQGDTHAPISRECLQGVTAGRYTASGANAALFGSRHPWMVSEGDDRYLTDSARRRVHRD